MIRQLRVTVLLGMICGFPTSAVAEDNSNPLERATKEVLARFDQGDRGWRIRMESLVRLAKAGPATVPALVEGLKSNSPATREFSAQALAMFNDPRARPALKRAVDDPNSTVRIYAHRALRMMGPLEPADAPEKLRADSDCNLPSTAAGALDRQDDMNSEALRKSWEGYDLARLDSARAGRLAPGFTLNAHSGETIRLGDFRGKQNVVLRYFRLEY
jgi:HEAT repeat protein